MELNHIQSYSQQTSSVFSSSAYNALNNANNNNHGNVCNGDYENKSYINTLLLEGGASYNNNLLLFDETKADNSALLCNNKLSNSYFFSNCNNYVPFSDVNTRSNKSNMSNNIYTSTASSNLKKGNNNNHSYCMNNKHVGYNNCYPLANAKKGNNNNNGSFPNAYINSYNATNIPSNSNSYSQVQNYSTSFFPSNAMASFCSPKKLSNNLIANSSNNSYNHNNMNLLATNSHSINESSNSSNANLSENCCTSSYNNVKSNIFHSIHGGNSQAVYATNNNNLSQISNNNNNSNGEAANNSLNVNGVYNVKNNLDKIINVQKVNVSNPNLSVNLNEDNKMSNTNGNLYNNSNTDIYGIYHNNNSINNNFLSAAAHASNNNACYVGGGGGSGGGGGGVGGPGVLTHSYMNSNLNLVHSNNYARYNNSNPTNIMTNHENINVVSGNSSSVYSNNNYRFGANKNMKGKISTRGGGMMVGGSKNAFNNSCMENSNMYCATNNYYNTAKGGAGAYTRNLQPFNDGTGGGGGLFNNMYNTNNGGMKNSYMNNNNNNNNQHHMLCNGLDKNHVYNNFEGKYNPYHVHGVNTNKSYMQKAYESNVGKGLYSKGLRNMNFRIVGGGRGKSNMIWSSGKGAAAQLQKGVNHAKNSNNSKEFVFEKLDEKNKNLFCKACDIIVYEIVNYRGEDSGNSLSKSKKHNRANKNNKSKNENEEEQIKGEVAGRAGNCFFDEEDDTLKLSKEYVDDAEKKRMEDHSDEGKLEIEIEEEEEEEAEVAELQRKEKNEGVKEEKEEKKEDKRRSKDEEEIFWADKKDEKEEIGLSKKKKTNKENENPKEKDDVAMSARKSAEEEEKEDKAKRINEKKRKEKSKKPKELPNNELAKECGGGNATKENKDEEVNDFLEKKTDEEGRKNQNNNDKDDKNFKQVKSSNDLHKYNNTMTLVSLGQLKSIQFILKKIDLKYKKLLYIIKSFSDIFSISELGANKQIISVVIKDEFLNSYVNTADHLLEEVKQYLGGFVVPNNDNDSNNNSNSNNNNNNSNSNNNNSDSNSNNNNNNGNSSNNDSNSNNNNNNSNSNNNNNNSSTSAIINHKESKGKTDLKKKKINNNNNNNSSSNAMSCIKVIGDGSNYYPNNNYYQYHKNNRKLSQKSHYKTKSNFVKNLKLNNSIKPRNLRFPNPLSTYSGDLVEEANLNEKCSLNPLFVFAKNELVNIIQQNFKDKEYIPLKDIGQIPKVKEILRGLPIYKRKLAQFCKIFPNSFTVTEIVSQNKLSNNYIESCVKLIDGAEEQNVQAKTNQDNKQNSDAE